jgi:ABC-type anion transport system duplicated permease subunit
MECKIVAEYFHFGGQTFSTMGLGSAISQAIDAGDIDLLISVPLLLWLAQ